MASGTNYPRRSQVFPPVNSAVPAARHWAHKVLDDWGMAASDAELALNELISNAVVHGSGDIRADLIDLGSGIRIEVHDHGGSAPRFHRRASDNYPGGRGLDIINRVSTTWGWRRPEPGGTTVWAVVPRAPFAAG